MIPGHSGRRWPTAERREVGVVEQVGPLDHEQEALEHLRGVRVEADETVLGLLDRRRLEATGRRGERRTAAEVVRQVGERRARRSP